MCWHDAPRKLIPAHREQEGSGAAGTLPSIYCSLCSSYFASKQRAWESFQCHDAAGVRGAAVALNKWTHCLAWRGEKEGMREGGERSELQACCRQTSTRSNLVRQLKARAEILRSYSNSTSRTSLAYQQQFDRPLDPNHAPYMTAVAKTKPQ